MKFFIILCTLLFVSYSCENGGKFLKKECRKIQTNTEDCKIYKNDVLYSEGIYYKNLKYGWHTFYNIDGLKDSIIEYIVDNSNSSIINQTVYFDKDGDTLYNKSSFFTIVQSAKSIDLSDSIDLGIKVNIPKEEKCYYKMEIQLNHPNDSGQLMVFVSDSLKKNFKITPLKKGNYNLQGVILIGRFTSSSLETNDAPVDTKKFLLQIDFSVK